MFTLFKNTLKKNSVNYDKFSHVITEDIANSISNNIIIIQYPQNLKLDYFFMLKKKEIKNFKIKTALIITS